MFVRRTKNSLTGIFRLRIKVTCTCGDCGLIPFILTQFGRAIVVYYRPNGSLANHEQYEIEGR